MSGSERSGLGTKHVTAKPTIIEPVHSTIKATILEPGHILLSNNIAHSTTGVGSPAAPLTLANVATIPSSLSTIATESVSSRSDSDSELSFTSSSAASSDAPSVVSQAGEELLGRLFGPTHLAEFARHGVKVGGVPATDDATFEGVTLESQSHDGSKTLYCVSSDVEELSKEGLVDLMEMADEELDCTALVICLDKKKLSRTVLSETLHSLMYVGGQIVARDAGLIEYNSKDFVLVGLEL